MDVRGTQEGYVLEVNLWDQFHDKIPSTNSNKFLPDVRSICLKYQLLDRAYFLCSGIRNEIIGSYEFVSSIIVTIHIREPLSFTTQFTTISTICYQLSGFATYEGVN